MNSTDGTANITVKADLLTPLLPLLDEIKVSDRRKIEFLRALNLRNYNRCSYTLRDALMYAIDSF